MSNFIEMPISFKRQYASSLVEDEVFENAEARLNYLSSGLAYSGQLVAQADDATVYVVNSAKDGYIKLGSSSDLTFKIVNTYNDLPKDAETPTSNIVFYVVKDYTDNSDIAHPVTYENGFYLYNIEQSKYIKISSEEKTVSENCSVFEPVGGIKDNYNAFGKTAFEVLHEMLYPVTSPIVTLTPVSKVYEIGSTVGALNIETNITKKSFNIDKIDITANGVNIFSKDGSDGTVIKDGGSFTCSHTPTEKDSNITLKVEVLAGSTSVSKESILSFARAGFYGTDSANNTAYTLSDEVRGLANKVVGVKAGSKFTINIPVGAKMVVIAVPQSINLGSVKYVEGMNAEVKDVFSLTTVSVEGAESYTAETYNLYTYIPVSAYGKTATYNVTLA